MYLLVEHYKVPNQKQAERKMTYILSWMLMLWLLTVLTALYIDLALNFNHEGHWYTSVNHSFYNSYNNLDVTAGFRF